VLAIDFMQLRRCSLTKRRCAAAAAAAAVRLRKMGLCLSCWLLMQRLFCTAAAAAAAAATATAACARSVHSLATRLMAMEVQWP
jgi:hypothetical protein